MLLQTLVDTKLHWTKITSSASKLGTFSPFFCFVFFFFVLKIISLFQEFVVLAYIHLLFETLIYYSIDVNMNRRNCC